MSLRGARVLVTRARADAGPLEDLLRAEGAEPVPFPCIELSELPAALPEQVDFIAFASAHAARILCARAPALVARAQLAAAGAGTAAALRTAAPESSTLVPLEGVGAEALAELLAPLVRGKSVLVPRAESGNPVLPERLAAAGARVTVVSLYRTIPAQVAEPAGLAGLRAGNIDVIALASGSAAQGFAALLGTEAAALASRCAVVCMGPACAAATRELGLPVAAVSEGGFPELCKAIGRALVYRMRT